MTNWQQRAIALVIGCWIGNLAADAQEVLRPDEPFASIDGSPILVGELNLILGQQLGIDQIGTAQANMKQAVAMLLVRQHLAMRSLRQSGGEALEGRINNRIEKLTDELERRNSSLAAHAETRRADEKSLVANLAWQVAWSTYLNSRLNDRNLRRYFEKHPGRYGDSFDELTDHSRLRRDATDALFAALVRRQQQAKVVWLVPQWRPPERIPVIP